MPAARIPPGGTRGTVFREIARQRLDDAGILLDQNRFNGAIYLAGYAIECYLKYAICRHNGWTYLPSGLEVHSWDILIREGNLLPLVERQRTLSVLFIAVVDQWGPSLRYRTSGFPRREAARLYSEIKQAYQALSELVP